MAETKLSVRIGSDLRDIKQGLNELRSDLGRVRDQSARAFAAPDNRFVNGLKAIRNQLIGIAGAYVSIRGLSQLVTRADEYGQLRARLQGVTRDQAEYNAVLERTREVADRSYRSIEDISEIFIQSAGPMRQLGIESGKVLDITEALSLSLVINATNAQTSSSVIDQFGKAMQTGVLRGEAFNAVLRGAPQFITALERSLGKSRAEIIKMASDGKLTAEVIGEVASELDNLRQQSDALPATVEDAATRFGNAFLQFAGDLNDFTDLTGRLVRATDTFSNMLQQVPQYFDQILRVVKLLAVYFATRYVAATVLASTATLTWAGLVKVLTAAVVGLRTALLFLTGPAGLIAALAVGIYAVVDADRAGKRASEERKKAIDELNRAQGKGIELSLEAARVARDQARADLDAARAALSLARADLAKNREALQEYEGGDPMVRAYGGAGADAGIARAQILEREALSRIDKLTEEIIGLDLAITEGENRLLSYQASVSDAVATGAGAAVRGVLDLAELATDAVNRSLAELDRLLEANQVSLAEYFQRKKDLQIEAIDIALEQARQEATAAKTSEAQGRALTQIVKLQRDRAEIGPRIAREQAAAEQDLTEKLEELRIKLLELQGDTSAATEARLSREFADLRARLEAEGNAAGLELVNRVVNTQLLTARLADFRTQVQDTMAALSREESSLSAQAAAGMIGQLEAEVRIKELRQQSIEQLQALRAEVAAYYEATKDPGVLAFLSELDTSIAQVAASQQKLRQQIADTAIDAMTNFFTDLATGAKSAKEALIDFVRSFVLGMAQIAARALATYLVLQMLDAIYPGLGKATAAGMGMSAGVNHTGGIIGAGNGVRRNVGPVLSAMFNAGIAPRFHTGGFPGMKSDEVAAILQKGEEVLAKNDPRNALNGGAAGGGQRGNQRFIFIDDERRVEDYLSAPESDEVFVQKIGRNAGAIRELIR